MEHISVPEDCFYFGKLNSTDLDEMSHVIWVFTICLITCLTVSRKNSLNPFMIRNSQTGTLVNSEHSDDMLHNAFVLFGTEIEIEYFFEIITSDPSISTMDHPDLTVSNFNENSIGPKRVKDIQPL